MVSDEREKVWRRLIDTHIPYKISSIRIIESEVFAPQHIRLDRITAFIGSHGTGKTLILRILEAAFGYITPASSPPFIGKVSQYDETQGVSGIVEIELKTPGGNIFRRINLSDSAEQRRQIWTDAISNMIELWYVSPLYMFSELSIVYQEFRAMREKTLKGSTQSIKASKRRAINSILQREYTEILVHPDYTMDNESDDIFRVPYITAQTRDKFIDVSMMSSGEIWVQYVLNWYLSDGTPDGHVVLLDEPEAFLANRAQRPFIDQVARQALSKNIQLFLGTHSPEVLARLPIANIRMCINSAQGVRVITPASMFQIREIVGLQTPIRILVLVEDVLAKSIMSSLFARYDRALTREAEIITAGGEGEVINGLKVFGGAEKLKCLAVLDADQRDKNIADNDRIFFLPGTRFPEDELVSAFAQAVAQSAKRIGATPEDILAAVGSCRGLDHQYWIKEISAQLGLDQNILTHEMIQTWLQKANIEQDAKALVQVIRSHTI